MKTSLQFLRNDTRSPSDCGLPLIIESSSGDLAWQGVLLEKGWSPHFFPRDVVTPYFYFALAIERELHWDVQHPEKIEKVSMVPGDIWFNPPWHPFTHHIEEPCFFIILAIDEDRFFELGGIRKNEREFLNNYNLRDDYLKKIMEMFSLETANGGRNGRPFVEQLLSLFCRYFLDHYSSDARGVPAPRIGPEEIERVQEYVMQNLSELISMDDLAAELNMSKFHFLREFKKATEKTPYQYVIETRLDRATRLLGNPGLSLSDIAYQLGFSDQSHFTRHFKRQYGQSPGRFRRVHGSVRVPSRD